MMRTELICSRKIKVGYVGNSFPSPKSIVYAESDKKLKSDGGITIRCASVDWGEAKLRPMYISAMAIS